MQQNKANKTNSFYPEKKMVETGFRGAPEVSIEYRAAYKLKSKYNIYISGEQKN